MCVYLTKRVIIIYQRDCLRILARVASDIVAHGYELFIEHPPNTMRECSATLCRAPCRLGQRPMVS